MDFGTLIGRMEAMEKLNIQMLLIYHASARVARNQRWVAAVLLRDWCWCALYSLESSGKTAKVSGQ